MTLYALLRALKNAAINITTIEDPVEMHIPGINQVAVNARIGLDFAKVLRAMLRQDPDVIMIGEIRDSDTAKIALQAASTGHLVLGTVHANHGLSVLNRLALLGLNVFDCLEVLVLIIAQRLVRQLCKHCAADQVKQACVFCEAGYHGRVGVFEVLLPDVQLNELLAKQLPMHDIAAMLAKQGWLSLQAAAMQKVALGITSVSEVERVVGYG